MALTAGLAYVTGDLPGIGGVIKQTHADFLVEEQPLYDPIGEGEHLYLYVEKDGLTTTELIRRVAKAFRVSKREVGYAGLKDKHAVTRQHLSIHLPGGTAEQDAESVERLAGHAPTIKLLWHARHGNKLKRGYHGGNRFVLYVRDVEPTAVVRAKPILGQLERDGVPNYFGEQRFGYRGNGHELGRLLLRGDYPAMLDAMLGDPRPDESEALRRGRASYDAGDYDAALEHWPRSLRFDRQALDALRQHKPPAVAVGQIDEGHRVLLASAFQSAVFNRVLDRRVRAGRFPALIEGDLAWKHDSGAVFAADADVVAAENAPGGRVASKAVSPSGPMWGAGMTRASGEADAIEVAALADVGFTPEQLDAATDPPAVSPGGSRRPTRVMLTDPDLSGGVDDRGPYVRLSFQLPKGAFATTVLREVMKNAAIHRA